MSKLILTFFILLVITCASEGIISLFFKPRKKRLIFSILVNVATNPLLNLMLTLVYFSGIKWIYIMSVIFGECAVVLIEAVIYKKVMFEAFNKSLVISLILNSFSFFIGLIFL